MPHTLQHRPTPVPLIVPEEEESRPFGQAQDEPVPLEVEQEPVPLSVGGEIDSGVSASTPEAPPPSSTGETGPARTPGPVEPSAAGAGGAQAQLAGIIEPLGDPGTFLSGLGDAFSRITAPLDVLTETAVRPERAFRAFAEGGPERGFQETLETFRERPASEQIPMSIATDPFALVGAVRGALAGGRAVTGAGRGLRGAERAAPSPAPSAQAGSLFQEAAPGLEEASGRLFREAPEKLAPGGTQAPQETVAKLTTLIREAKPVRAETEVLKSAERGRRVGRAAQILEGGEGREAFQQARSPLAGELPRAQFEPPEVGLAPDEVTGMFNQIRDSGKQFFTRLNTGDALTKVLAGEIPTRGEIALLEDMFGPELSSAILSKRRFGEKFWEGTMDALNFPRAVRTAYDASAPFRQGVVLAPGHPRAFSRSFVTMMKSWAKEGAAQEVDGFLRNHPNFELFQNSGLFHAERVGTARGLAAREEAFMSRFASRIPGIRQSERAYVTFLNKLRFDVMNGIYEGWVRAGKDITDADMRSLASFINHATGRGDIPRFAQRVAPTLNATFFSPRLQISRFQLPVDLVMSTPEVRKVVARDLAAFVGTGVTILSLLKLSGLADVEADPRSSDFGKIRAGNTRWEFWGSFQPIARYTAQLRAGKQKNLATGKIMPIPRREIVGRFLRSKLGPPGGFITDAMTGRTFLGEEFGAPRERFGVTIPGPAATALENLTPMFIDDLVEAIEIEGLLGGFRAAPGFFGVGTQTFETNDDFRLPDPLRNVPEGLRR